MKVTVSDQVKKFLTAEKDYLKKHSSSAHKRLALRMREFAKTLSDFPMAGSERSLPVPGLRRFVVDDYVLDYEIAGDEVHILNMRHGRQRDPYLEHEEDFDYEIDLETLPATSTR